MSYLFSKNRCSVAVYVLIGAIFTNFSAVLRAHAADTTLREGSSGSTESTARIMARSSTAHQELYEQIKNGSRILIEKIAQGAFSNQPTQAVPNSCATLPVCRTGSGAFLSASSAPISARLQPNFIATTFAQTLFVPPDPQGAVGPTQYIVLCNGRIKSFNKGTGKPDGILDTTTNNFFKSVVGQGYFTADPNIRYDRHSNRWFVTMMNFPNRLPSSTTNKLLIAVSSAATITPATRWTFFSFRADATAFIDAPSLGIDSQALYVGTNSFSQSPSGALAYRSTLAFVIPKAPLLAGRPIRFAKFTVASNSKRGPLTAIGVDNFDSASPAGFFIGTDNFSQNNLVLLRVLNPTTTPTLSANILIPVPDYIRTLLVPHKGNTGGRAGYLDSVGTRLSMTHIRGKHLFTSHTVGVSNTGVSSPSAVLSRNGCRFYEINLTTPTAPSLVQMGTLFAPTATNDLNQRHYFIPSLMTNSVKTIVVGCTTAGAQVFIDAAFALRYASDPLGKLRQPVRYTTSNSAYNPSFDRGRPEGRRWGDYSGMAVDPSDDMTIWATQQYCNAPNTFALRAVRIPASPPPAVTRMVPTQVRSSSVKQSIEFTAPVQENGQAFAPGVQHAVLNLGPCISVVRSRVLNKNRIQADVITRCAKPGRYDVEIINPDGQRSFAPRVMVIS